jgi:hypothetical protein
MAKATGLEVSAFPFGREREREREPEEGGDEDPG